MKQECACARAASRKQMTHNRIEFSRVSTLSMDNSIHALSVRLQDIFSAINFELESLSYFT